MSPFSLDKTMEEVSAGFGVAFPGKYESGDFEKDYEDMEEALLCSLTASKPDDEDLVLYGLLKPPYDASHEV